MKDEDVKVATVLAEVPAGEAEDILEADWDALN